MQDRAADGRARGAGGRISTGIRLLGELLITAGVVLVLFIGWQLWWTNVESAATQREVVEDFARQVNASPVQGDGPGVQGSPAVPSDAAAGYGPAITSSEPAVGATIGILYVPRFGADYSRPIVQGTDPAVLDTLGIGHYAGTSMPGAAGNFAVAGHRQTHGAVLDNIDALVPGDRIYVQTRDGFYAYVFRNSEIVLPDRTDVLLPVPAQPAATPTEGYLTMTSCNPRFGSQERFVAYARLEQWHPGSAGPPADIAAQVQRTMREG
ncbi:MULTISPECIES: class E sortase [unclassified Arthrobacter]|uniref:class E sortase n=1 Tax=unclassified Arthrobacter TaxID=235627 RepID=UPI0027D89AC9|nr:MULTISPECIES: class E sortase [unclassified Arthrobacter]